MITKKMTSNFFFSSGNDGSNSSIAYLYWSLKSAWNSFSVSGNTLSSVEIPMDLFGNFFKYPQTQNNCSISLSWTTQEVTQWQHDNKISAKCHQPLSYAYTSCWRKEERTGWCFSAYGMAGHSCRAPGTDILKWTKSFFLCAQSSWDFYHRFPFVSWRE